MTVPSCCAQVITCMLFKKQSGQVRFELPVSLSPYEAPAPGVSFQSDSMYKHFHTAFDIFFLPDVG